MKKNQLKNQLKPIIAILAIFFIFVVIFSMWIISENISVKDEMGMMAGEAYVFAQSNVMQCKTDKDCVYNMVCREGICVRQQAIAKQQSIFSRLISRIFPVLNIYAKEMHAGATTSPPRTAKPVTSAVPIAAPIAAEPITLIHGSGAPLHLDIVFVAEGFSDEEIALLEVDINKLIFGDPAHGTLYNQLGFFGIAPISLHANKINVYYIKEDFISSGNIGAEYINSVLSFVKGKVPAFKSYADGDDKDIVVVLKKTESWAAGALIADTVMSGIISVPNIAAGSGIGWPNGISIPIIAHEFGHAFADMNDEYFWPGMYFTEEELYEQGAEQFGFGSVNCDLHKTPCEMWCNGIDEESYTQFSAAAELSRECYGALENDDETLWYEICQQLNIPEPNAQISGYGYAPWKTQEEKDMFCADFDFVKGQWYKFVLCTAGTIYPWSHIDLGASCQQGHGCYFGCAGKVNAFRSVPYSIMGCGAAGQCDQFYWYNADENTLLEFSSPAVDNLIYVFGVYE